MLASIFNRHLPGGILAIAQGGADVGRAVVDVSDHVIFTGGVAAGREVSMRCAEQLKTVSLELGGKDAAIVLKDCDVARTAQGIFWGAMTNSGQNCASIERVYVEQPVHDALVQRLCALAASTPLAPVATPEQEALVRRHLEDARDRGANLHGEYPGATIVTHVPEDALILREETFGPACPVVAVKDADDALRRANQSRFGLTTSIWTRDQARARRLARAADSGVVTINNVGFTAALPFVPWSGRRHSGHGTTNSPQSLYGLIQSKLIVEDTSSAPEPWWFPLGDEALALARETLRWLMASVVRKMIMLPGVMLAQRRRSKAQAKALKRLHSGMRSETD